jgi:thymidylate synthase (FAD)
MKVIKPSFVIESNIDKDEVLKHIEKAGRTAYKSEDKMTSESAEKFISKIMNFKHESVIEHYSITVRVICDRGVTHEIVRHRLASYTQESTRYVNYSKGKFSNEITTIEPIFWDKDSVKYKIWHSAMRYAENAYMELLEEGATPQEARSVLPNSLKTEIVMTMNLRSWRHFFELRCHKAAHPQMREIALPLLEEFKVKLPLIFDDLIF